MNLKFGYFSSIGQKAKQEDRLVCIPDMTSIPGLVEFSILPDKRLSYFAVFDGHGGAKCSTFLSQNFHMELGRHKKIVTQPITALRETWKGMDKIYYDHCLRQASGDESAVSCDGSTATVVLVVGDDMYILNCGDSAGGVISSEGTIEILTEDHGTHNSVEATRVVANGGVLRDQGIKFYKPFPLCCFAASQQAKLRLYPGGLLVTRAFGDFNAKVAILGGIAGVVIHDHGEVRHKKLDSGIRSIILASDGLWDGLSKIQIENILRGRRLYAAVF